MVASFQCVPENFSIDFDLVFGPYIRSERNLLPFEQRQFHIEDTGPK